MGLITSILKGIVNDDNKDNNDLTKEEKEDVKKGIYEPDEYDYDDDDDHEY